MNKLKHFLIFAIISFLLVFLQNFIGRNTNPGDKLLQILNIIAVVEIPLLITIMIRI